MKYIEKIPPTEVLHNIQCSDTELKFLLELVECIAQNNAILLYSDGTKYKPNDKGFDILAGIVQMTNIVSTHSYDPLKFWTELDTQALKK